jgi:hypothetical protein
MKNKSEIFRKYKDESGETYFCPMDAVNDDRYVSEWELDNCVEVSTVGRYSGNIDVVGRFN